MSVVITISSEHGKEVISDEQIRSLIDNIPELGFSAGLLVWQSDDGREVFFNVEPTELISDTIETEDDYALVERISEHLGLKIYVEGEAVDNVSDSTQLKQGCGTVCIIISGLLASFAYTLTK
ncbi:hypothetical protein [Persicirhabdus sediminis]|uniref:Uncharacterized protein n=1 Tax=Persicirhabdus sediminis TaxID=454144 RepID=A0A8J7MBP7_9BACT|nr:hypothetical protein [Persicirhabdus sediminis]MBK1789541.1 hypothetical protein [Persicirhabdus sediminis]